MNEEMSPCLSRSSLGNSDVEVSPLPFVGMLVDAKGETGLRLDGIAGAGGKMGLELCIGASRASLSVIIIDSNSRHKAFVSIVMEVKFPFRRSSGTGVNGNTKGRKIGSDADAPVSMPPRKEGTWSKKKKVDIRLSGFRFGESSPIRLPLDYHGRISGLR